MDDCSATLGRRKPPSSARDICRKTATALPGLYIGAVSWPRVARVALVVVVVVLALTARSRSGPPRRRTTWAGGSLNAALARCTPCRSSSPGAGRSPSWPSCWARPRSTSPSVATAAAVVRLADRGVRLGSYATAVASGVGWCWWVPPSGRRRPRLQQGDPLEDVLPGWFVLAVPGGWGRGCSVGARRWRTLAEEAEALARDRDEATRAAVAYERARMPASCTTWWRTHGGDRAAGAGRGRVLDAESSGTASLRAIESTGREGLTSCVGCSTSSWSRSRPT